MANAIGLAMQISASTSSLAQGLSEADRLISKLGQGAIAAAKEFDSFRDSSGALPAQMQSIVDQAGFLADAFRGGAASSEEFKAGIAEVADAASQISAIFEAGAATTARYTTEEEKNAQALAAIEEQYAAGAISVETYNRAKDDLTGVTAAAAQAERDAAAASQEAAAAANKAAQEAAATTAKYATEEEKKAAALAKVDAQLAAGLISYDTHSRAVADLTGATEAANKAEQEAAAVRQRAAAITASVASPTEKYAATTKELDTLLKQGAITQETYNRALEKAKADLDKAAAAADGFGKKAKSATDGLKFNELSGVIGLLPGPLGSVASKISSASSAAEGLGKVFSTGGGLGGAVAQLGSAFQFLTTPIGQAAAGLVAFGAAATAVVGRLSGLADQVEKLNNISIKTGASFEFLQVLGESAVRAGSSVDAAGAAFTKLTRAIDGAKNGSKESTEAFARIGISVQELESMTPEEVFKRTSAELLKLEDPAARSALAMKLFGRSGAELLPTLMGIAEAEKDMQKFFATLSDFDKIRLENVDSAFERLSTAGTGLANSLTMPFSQMTADITNGIAEFTGGITAIVKPIGQVLEPVFTSIGRLVEFIGIILGGVGQAIGTLLAPIGDAVEAVSSALAPVYDFLTDLLQGFIDASVAVGQFVLSFSPISLIADLIGYLAGLFGEFYGAISAALEPVGNVVGRVTAIFQAFRDQIGSIVGGVISEFVSRIGELVSAFLEFTGIGDVISAVATGIGAAFSSAWEIIKGVIGTIGGLIDQVLTFAEDWLGIERGAEAAAAGADKAAEATNKSAASQKEVAKAAKEAEKAQQKAQESLEKAVEQSNEKLNTAIEKSAEYGQAGFDAALKFQNAIKDLQDQASEGELDATQYSRGVANAQKEYDRQIDSLKKIQEETKKAADEAQRRADADAKVADKLLDQQRLMSEFGGNKEKMQANEDLAAVDRERLRLEEEINAARERGDQAAIDAASQRLAALDQARTALAETAQFGFNQSDIDKAIKNVSDKIEAGISQADVEIAPDAADALYGKLEQLKQQLGDKLIDPEQFKKAAEAAMKQFETIASVMEKTVGSLEDADFQIAPEAADAFVAEMEKAKRDFQDGLIDEKQFQKAGEKLKKQFEEAKKQAEQIAKLEEKYAEEAAKIEEERIKELSKTSQKELKATDIRTSEGASQLLRLATGREDPAIEEYKKQLSKLDEIKKEIAKTASQPVAILGGA